MTSVICPYFCTISFKTTVFVTMPAAPRSIHGFRSSGSPASQTAGPDPVARAIAASPGTVAFIGAPLVEGVVCSIPVTPFALRVGICA